MYSPWGFREETRELTRESVISVDKDGHERPNLTSGATVFGYPKRCRDATQREFEVTLRDPSPRLGSARATSFANARRGVA